jgi:O-acetyl-ADP-ribose deacetylase
MRLELVLGDITEQPLEAIVNAANSSLLGGSGVDGAIHRRGGPEVGQACRALRAGAYPHGLPTGQAVATTAGRLPARWVIHTVGPVYSDTEDRSELLRSCYRQSLRVAGELGAGSIAFPLISAGAYRWPVRSAVELAVQVLGAAGQPGTSVKTARLVLWQPETLALAREVLAAATGPAGGTA